MGLAFLANVTSLFGVAQAYGPLWTLAVEEQFYLFWPAAVWRLSRRGFVWLASAVVVLTPLARGVAFRYGQTNGLAEYTWFGLDGLACGALLAVLLRSGISRRGVSRIALTLVAIAVVAGLAGWPFGIATRARLAGAAFQYTLISLFFSGMLLLTLLGGTRRWTWLTTNRPLRFLGFISYGLYLIHVLVFWLVRPALPPACAADAATRRSLRARDPALRDRGWGGRPPRLAVARALRGALLAATSPQTTGTTGPGNALSRVNSSSWKRS